MGSVQLDVWSDFACPWCWVGKRHLEEAVAQTDADVSIRWRSFQLNPHASRTAMGTVDYAGALAKKYAMARGQAEAFLHRMKDAGAQVGIDFRFDLHQPSNTFDAHRLLHAARDAGVDGALKEAFCHGLMADGRSLNDAEALTTIAAGAGLPADIVQGVLGSDAHADSVEADRALAARLGISGVPFFLAESRVGLSGAQPPEAIVELVERGEALASQGASCSIP